MDLGGVALTNAQRELCGRGFDERQLCMLKAQVLAHQQLVCVIIFREKPVACC